VKHLPSARDRAATVLALLHREVLTGDFDPTCSSVAATLDSGRYNCVTTTILFVTLAEAIELPTSITHAPGHVRVRIEGTSPLELEPTCAHWFAQTDPQLLPTREPTRVISFPALLGKLYYNRGIEALEARQFPDAIAAFEHSRTLDPMDATAQQNLLAALNNGALALCDERQFEAASRWLRKAEQIDPNYPPLAANDLHLHGQWLIALCEAARYADAIELMDHGLARRPQAELFRVGRSAVYRLWAEDLLRRGEPHAALARIEAGLVVAPHDTVLQQMKSRLER
jgi:tetratricopeptide (TPR) repeat protein